MEDGGRGNLSSFLLSELVAPGNTLGSLGALATVIVLKVAGSLFAMLLPVVPTFRTDVAAEVTVHEERVAVVAPGTTQIDLRSYIVGNQTAVVENVAEGLVLWGGGSRDVGVHKALDGAALEPSRGGAEDKVGGAADVAVLEEETGSSHARVDSVLMADETAVDEGEAITLGMQGYGLSQTGSVILDGDILQRDVVTLDLQCISSESAHRLEAWGSSAEENLHVRMVVVGDDGVLGTLTTDFNILQPLGDDEFLFVGAVLHEDDLVVVHESATNLNGFVNSSELSRAVACYDEGVGIVVLASSKSSEK